MDAYLAIISGREVRYSAHRPGANDLRSKETDKSRPTTELVERRI
jgi:hypothetical protein